MCMTQENGPTISVTATSSLVMVGDLDMHVSIQLQFVGYTTSLTGERSEVSAPVDVGTNVTARKVYRQKSVFLLTFGVKNYHRQNKCKLPDSYIQLKYISIVLDNIVKLYGYAYRFFYINRVLNN